MSRIFKSGFYGFFTALAFSVSSLPSVAVAETFEIDQVMDMKTLHPEDLYQFVPNYYWVEPGDTIRFLNSTGNHTVKPYPEFGRKARGE